MASKKSPLNPTGKKHRFGKAWMQEHVNDPYVIEAKAKGYRSRAAFKLLELAQKDQLIRRGMAVIDLGAAPGSWSQVLGERLGPAARIFALDILPMEPIRNVEFLQGDFRDDAVLAALDARLENRLVDLVVSDLAPNLSGVESADQARSIHLAELTLDFAENRLQAGGDLVVKAFQGSGLPEYQKAMQARFAKVYVRKPKASRDRSREIYLVGKGYKGSLKVFVEAASASGRDSPGMSSMGNTPARGTEGR